MFTSRSPTLGITSFTNVSDTDIFGALKNIIFSLLGAAGSNKICA